MTTTQEEAPVGAITKMLEEKLWKYNITYDDIIQNVRTLELSLIEKLSKDDGWISVEDRLPEVWQDVLVLDRWTFHYDSYLKSNGMWFINNTFYTEEAYASNVTHWQPLPNQPVLPSNK